MKPRIYVDTSVIGGCLDDEFETESLALMEMFNTGQAIAVISDLTDLEVRRAPPWVGEILDRINGSSIEHVGFVDEARDLAQKYVDAGALGNSNLLDAQHIATATVSRVDVLVSWNFKHIVNLQRIRMFNSVNVKLGYPMIEIRTPQEVISYEER